MRTNNRILPYPVLGNFDAVLPVLPADALTCEDPDIGEQYIHFEYHLKHENETITTLVSDGKAEYMCDVYCEKTHMQKRYLSDVPEFVMDISRKEIAGHVGFEFFIVLKESIEYSNPGFNEDYQGHVFKLERGDILAVFPIASFNAKLISEKLYAVGSFIKFKDGGDADYSVDLDDDVIFIKLPHRLFETYADTIKGNDDFSEIILSSIVCSALEYALVNYDPDKHSTKDWADALKERFKQIDQEEGLKFDEPKHAQRIAQLILQDPYTRMFNQLVEISRKLTEREDYDGTTENF